jgi:hypothetical protein
MVEWAIFAMVANGALAPDSKRSVEDWVRKDVALGNPEPISLQHLYRAMDFLLEHEESIQKEVFFATADLLNLEVDLLSSIPQRPMRNARKKTIYEGKVIRKTVGRIDPRS